METSDGTKCLVSTYTVKIGCIPWAFYPTDYLGVEDYRVTNIPVFFFINYEPYFALIFTSNSDFIENHRN